MADSIATRVARIVSGGAHSLLDKVEDLAPEAVMNQSIREIELVEDEVRADLGRAEAAKHLVLSQVARLNGEHEALAEQIEMAVAQGRDDLATTAIGRQTDIEDQLPVLQKSLDEQSERSRELESYITALRAKKRELDALAREYVAAAARAQAGGAAAPLPDHDGRVARAQSSFDRVLARQTGVASLTGAPAADAAKLKELADMQRNNRIAERLASVKAAHGAGEH